MATRTSLPIGEPDKGAHFPRDAAALNRIRESTTVQELVVVASELERGKFWAFHRATANSKYFKLNPSTGVDNLSLSNGLRFPKCGAIEGHGGALPSAAGER